MVRIVDRAGKTLAEGLTDADGKFGASAAATDAFAVQFERVGYLRRPEIMTLPPTIRTPLHGRLLRATGTSAYYRQVGTSIERNAPQSAARGWDISREMDRASELPQDARAAIESGLSVTAKAELNSAREEILATAKAPGNQLTAPFSVSPALRDFSGWVGVGATTSATDRATIMRNLMGVQSRFEYFGDEPSMRAQRQTYSQLLEQAIRPTGPSDLNQGIRCVTEIGVCPMAKTAAASSVCFCYTPYGMHYGLASSTPGVIYQPR